MTHTQTHSHTHTHIVYDFAKGNAYAMLCSDALCCAYAYAKLCDAMLCHAMPCYAVQCKTKQ